MRLDCYLVENKYYDTRTKAKQAIERGEIYVNGKKTEKCSLDVCGEVNIEIKSRIEYVSLGGYKLEKALDDFNLSVNGLTVADVGASTGGFTDCVLQRGAKKVFSVDLRDDLLHSRLKNDDRVVSVIKNAKALTERDFSNKIDLIVADLSFISIKQVMPVFYNLIDQGKRLLILIKPQFETGKRMRFKNGIIRDEKIHYEVCRSVFNQSIECGFSPIAITTAPISKDKNTEFLFLLKKDCEKGIADFDRFYKNIR